MESEAGADLGAVAATMERMGARLEAAATLFERAMSLLEERDGEVRKLVAAVETNHDGSREAELEKKLAAAEEQIAELKAQIGNSETRAHSSRRTVAASTAQFLARQGISTPESVEAGALDAALDGLSLEQRIAVKAQLLRTGLLA